MFPVPSFEVSIDTNLNAILANYAISAQAEAERFDAEVASLKIQQQEIDARYQKLLDGVDSHNDPYVQAQKKGVRANLESNWQQEAFVVRKQIKDAENMALNWKLKAKVATGGHFLCTYPDTQTPGMVQSKFFQLALAEGRVKYATRVEDLQKLAVTMGVK